MAIGVGNLPGNSSKQDPPAEADGPVCKPTVVRARLRRLVSNEPRLGERLEVTAIDAIGERLYEPDFGAPRFASREQTRALLAEAAEAAEPKPKIGFLLSEWEELVDAWQVDSWEAYRDVRRLGCKTRLPEKQRAALWSIFEAVRAGLRAQELVTRAEMFTRLAGELAGRKHAHFDFAVVDESQDLSPAQLRFLAAIGKSHGADRPNALFFAGDLGQRIFQQPFSWKSLGVDIRGRARTLHIVSRQLERQCSSRRFSHGPRAGATSTCGIEVTVA